MESGVVQTVDDRALAGHEHQQRLIASPLAVGEGAHLCEAGEPPYSLFLKRPLLDEHDLIDQVPTVDLTFNLGQSFPA